MKWIEFSRLMQAVEYKTPTKTVSLLAKDFKEIENKTIFIDILSLDLGPNNLASKKALKWITKSLEVFEEEQNFINIHVNIVVRTSQVSLWILNGVVRNVKTTKENHIKNIGSK